MEFDKFNLSPQLQKALDKNNYTKSTPIQDKVIPLIIDGFDIMAKAQTGSGKTASFVLPLLNIWLENPILKRTKKDKIKILIVTPTRELTQQVANTFTIFSEFLPYRPKVVTIIGGKEIGEQLVQLQKGCDVVVATTGRLLDIIDKKQIDLSCVEYFIVDEADKMMDLGFEEQLENILKLLPIKRQNLLFSATYPQKMLNLATAISSEYQKVFLEDEIETKDNITQRVIIVNKDKRNPLLQHLIRTNKWNRVLVFMSSKKATDNLSTKFRRYGFLADSFHGGLEQEERDYTLDEFKNGKIKILFSTDIASRGLHIDDVSCVINYDLPRSTDDYIHRIGRTGRAGKKGIAISFINYENREHFKLIEKRCNLDIQKEEIDGFEFTEKQMVIERGTAPIKGKRMSKKDKLRAKQNEMEK